MYGLTVEQILKRLKISAICGIIFGIGLLCASLFALVTSGGTPDSNITIKEVILIFPMSILYSIILVWELMAYIINWKKILKGILLPIPFISMIIETFKGYVMAAKAIVYALKNRDNGKNHV